MSTFTKKMKWIAAFSLAALIIYAALATPASAIAVAWDAGGAPSILWATPENWDGDAVPGSSDDVTFNETGAVALTDPPTVTNEVDADMTINTLWYNQQDPTLYVHTTQIDPGVTLKISGTSSSISGSSGDYSLYAGDAGDSSASISQTVMTGGGALDISDASGGNTGGDIVVRVTHGSGGAHTAILDLSGLASLNANVDQILLGVTTSSVDRPTGEMYLAESNAITMNNPGTTVDAGLIIGYAYNRTPGDQYVVALHLGHDNTLNVDNVTIGGRRRTGLMDFNSAFIDSTTNLTMRGSDGSSRVALISIGDNTNNSGTGGTNTAKGTMDLSGGNVDIMADLIRLGITGDNDSPQGGNGTLTFDKGTIDTTGMILANKTVGTRVTAVGTVNVNGTANLVVGSGGLSMAMYTSGGSGTSTGTLNINGGTVTLGAAITDGGGTSVISMTGGILDMQGCIIGDPDALIDTISLENCTLDNIRQINADTLTISDGVTLNVSLGDVDLSYCHSYDILNCNNLSGTFTTVNLPDLSPGLHWDDSNLYVTGIIHVVPEPATLAMLIIAAGLCLMFRRTRGK